MPRPASPPAGERIAKLLARAGVSSRREVERMIAEGRVALDGTALTTPATVLADLAGVTVDGVAVAAPAPARLFLHHKPVGLLVTERDPAGRPTIYDRLPPGLPRLVPVGRLDLATEGLLLLTTDGGLKRRLELPATGVPRTYRARVYGAVSQGALEGLSEGIEIAGMRYGSIDANLERRTGANAWIELTLTEGKNREVRRVLEHLGLEVGRLIRTRYGPFLLGDLPAGGVGEVRPAIVEAFRRSLDGGPPVATVAVADERAAAPKPSHPHPSQPPRGQAPSLSRREREGAAQPRTGEDDADKAGRQQRIATPKQRAGAPKPSHPHPSHPLRGRAPSLSHREREGAAQPRKGEGEASKAGRQQRTARPGPVTPKQQRASPSTTRGSDAPPAPPRPPKLQRKPGWAKPKPRTGPGRPRG